MAHGQESIQSLLGGLLKDRRMLSSMRRVMVMTLWEQVVGDLVAQSRRVLSQFSGPAQRGRPEAMRP